MVTAKEISNGTVERISRDKSEMGDAHVAISLENTALLWLFWRRMYGRLLVVQITRNTTAQMTQMYGVVRNLVPLIGSASTMHLTILIVTTRNMDSSVDSPITKDVMSHQTPINWLLQVTMFGSKYLSKNFCRPILQ